MPRQSSRQLLQTRPRGIPLRVWGRSLMVALLFMGLFHLQEEPKASLPAFNGDLFALRRAAEEEDKLCLIRFYTDYCYACQGMETRLGEEPLLIETILADYLPYEVKSLESIEGRDLARRHQLRRAPLLLITDSEGRELSRFAYLPPTHQLIDTLFRLARLRTAPTYQPTLERPENQPPPPAYGLRLYQARSYAEARDFAQAQQSHWNQPLYIFPAAEAAFEVLVGVHDNKESTKVMQTFLKAWEEQELPLVEVAGDVSVLVVPGDSPVFQSLR